MKIFFGGRNGPELGAGAKLVPRWHSSDVKIIFGLIQPRVFGAVAGMPYDLDPDQMRPLTRGETEVMEMAAWAIIYSVPWILGNPRRSIEPGDLTAARFYFIGERSRAKALLWWWLIVSIAHWFITGNARRCICSTVLLACVCAWSYASQKRPQGTDERGERDYDLGL